MTIKPKPTDAEIKDQIQYWGSQQMTYVIRNGLSMAGNKVLKLIGYAANLNVWSAQEKSNERLQSMPGRSAGR